MVVAIEFLYSLLQLLEPEWSINTHYNYQGYLQVMITIPENELQISVCVELLHSNYIWFFTIYNNPDLHT